MAYQFGAGLGYKLSEKMTVSLAYRLFGTTDAEFNDGVDRIEAEYMSHSLMAGVAMKF